MVVGSYYCREGQHWVVWIDMRGVAGGLLDGFHFFLAAGVVKRTNYDRLAYGDVSGGG